MFVFSCTIISHFQLMHLISLWFEVEGSQCHSHSPDFFMYIIWLSIPISVRKFSSVYSNIHLYVHSFQRIFDCRLCTRVVGSKGEQDKVSSILR